MKSKSIVFSYCTVTPESAENGDFEDTGFTDSGRNRLTSPVEFISDDMGSLYDAIRLGIDLGILVGTNPWVGNWFESGSSIIDYSTGEEISYAMHLEGFSPRELSHIKRILKAGKISDSDEALLEGIMILNALGVSTY
jgi:hypothetical protein